MKVLALIALAVIVAEGGDLWFIDGKVTEGNINDVSDGFMSFLRWNIWKMHHNKVCMSGKVCILTMTYCNFFPALQLRGGGASALHDL